MQNILEIENLNLSFLIDGKKFSCIKNLNLAFEKGKMHAIVGESGCGKTMLMSSVLGILPNNAHIDSGKIFFEGRNLLDDATDLMKIRGRKIAYIPQDPMTSLNPLYTIENQLLEVVNLDEKKPLDKAREIIIQKLEEVGIQNAEERLKSYPHELSGGMRQRIIIAMALLTGAELIIADEPTTALDVTIQAQIMEILVQIKNSGKTIILITHNLALVWQYVDTATIMYLGEIVERNSAQGLFKNPQHPYTKALIQTLPKNTQEKLKNIKGQPSPITEIISGCAYHPRCDFCMEKCATEHPEFKNNVMCHMYS